jgi:hypothetical protein
MNNSPDGIDPVTEATLIKRTPLTRGEKVFLIYDVLMMVVITINLLTIGLDKFLLSHIGLVVAETFQQGSLIVEYRQHIHPHVLNLDEWFTLFLIGELLLRWVISVIYKHHQRWYFFPFIHWYEVLACLPSFRALRLLRAVAIGYRLYQLGYNVVPKSWLKKASFYYSVVLEELSDRIVITVLDGIESELKSTSTHHHLVQNLVTQHRQMISDAVAEVLQNNLANALHQQRQTIVDNVGQIVSRSIAQTPELHSLLRLIPVIGSRIEQQVQTIAQHLGENITSSLIDPFIQPTAPERLANAALTNAAGYIGDIKIDTPELEKLIESMVFSSIESIRSQVKIQQWKQLPQD